jgi:hypothetical protein
MQGAGFFLPFFLLYKKIPDLAANFFPAKAPETLPG